VEAREALVPKNKITLVGKCISPLCLGPLLSKSETKNYYFI